MTTLELPLFQSTLPSVAAERLAELLNVLSDGQWHKSRDLAVYGFTDRELRELVENSDGRILSFPGSPGYKDFNRASIEEIEQAKALLNQGRAMIRRFLRYKKRYHRRK